MPRLIRLPVNSAEGRAGHEVADKAPHSRGHRSARGGHPIIGVTTSIARIHVLGMPIISATQSPIAVMTSAHQSASDGTRPIAFLLLTPERRFTKESCDRRPWFPTVLTYGSIRTPRQKPIRSRTIEAAGFGSGYSHAASMFVDPVTLIE